MLCPANALTCPADVFAHPGTERDDASESRPPTDRVHECRACEIVEAHSIEPAAAPLPRSGKGIDDRDINRREDEERVQLDTLCDRPRHDRRGRGREHRLKNEIGPVGVGTVRVGDRITLRARIQPEPGEPKEPAEGKVTRIHQVEPDHRVGQQTDRDNRRVLEQDVDGVLRLRQSRLKTREAQVHDEHQERRNEHPGVVDGEELLRDGFRFLTQCNLGSGQEERNEQCVPNK